MAPSQMEQQQEQSLGQGYTHKKFNCSYSHKKLGMRLRQREDMPNNKENIANNLSQNEEITKRSKPCSSKGLFRPYALGDNSPRKRKISRDSESSDEETSQQQYIASPSTSPVAYYQPEQQLQQPAAPASPITCASPALSPNSYALRLQRQRAALYMRYMQQFHSGGNMAAYPPAMGYPNVTAPIFNGC